MPTPARIIANLRRCVRCCTFGAPAVEDLAELAADWGAVLAVLSDDALDAAVLAHLRDPERARHFPTPADIAAQAPRHEDDPATSWAVIVELVRGGDYEVEGLLPASHVEALRRVGGVYALRQAEGPAAIGWLQKQFLKECRDAASTAAVLALPTREARLELGASQALPSTRTAGVLRGA